MKKYILSFFFIIVFIGYKNVFAISEDCEQKELFELYQCRNENICEKYKSDKPVIITKNFKEAGINYGIEEAKSDYKKNMGDIYACSTLKSQKKSLEVIKQLIPIEKSGDLKDKIQRDIESKIKKVDLNFKQLKCKNVGKNDIYNKLAVLNQTTYELCRYTNYLEYLRDYNSNINNALGTNSNNNKNYTVTYIASRLKEIQTEIDIELNHTFKVYPLAFNVYSEYENNYTIHVLLELIKEDFVVFRDKLYRTISPINQVVYKISNAMSNK